MIKLKIGDNYFITNGNNSSNDLYIPYLISCYKGHNKILTSIDPGMGEKEIYDKIDFIKKEKVKDLVLLTYIDVSVMKVKSLKRNSYKSFHNFIRSVVNELKMNGSTEKITVIEIKPYEYIDKYNLGFKLMNTLKEDPRNLLHHIRDLDHYREFSSRLKSIEPEIKVIESNIKKLSKEKKVSDKKVTLETLKYMGMIDKVELGDFNNLTVYIKPLPIYPSEELGKCLARKCFETNPYLFRAAWYIYHGCHFQMVGTKINVEPGFKPVFLETLDHTWDDMFKVNNWSTIGYLHFGQGHLCGGEFNDVIAHTAEHGLEYYFLCLKQYITTANMRDIAGYRVWWYPIYDNEGNFVYCAGLDNMKHHLEPRYPEIKDMTLLEFLKWKQEKNITFLSNGVIDTRYTSSNIRNDTRRDGGDNFLELCEELGEEKCREILEGSTEIYG